MAARVAVGGGDGAGDVGAGGSRGKASGPLGEGSTSSPGEFMFRGCYIGIMEKKMETTLGCMGLYGGTFKVVKELIVRNATIGVLSDL